MITAPATSCGEQLALTVVLEKPYGAQIFKVKNTVGFKVNHNFYLLTKV